MEDGYYWFTSERSTRPTVGQLARGQWYFINEVGPVSLEVIKERGWDLDKRIEKQDDEWWLK